MREMHRLLLLSIFLLATVPTWAVADEPPREPVLRIEAGMHTAPIKRIGIDAAGRYLVTGSEDKTVRVWDLATGRLLQMLRPPIGAGNEGKVFAVALSPDGQTVAVGGWTGYEWERSVLIYLFDRATGQLRRRLTGLPTAIKHLAYSPDGQRFVATLGHYGIRVYQTSDETLVGEDRDYGADSYGASFDAAGRLVTSSSDGFIRLYDSSLRLLAKQQAPGGRQPIDVSVSPDGTKVAVVYHDSTRVDVLSGEDLSLLYTPDTTEVRNGNFLTVAWSADGRQLYAGGGYNVQVSGKWMFVVRTWPLEGHGRPTDWPAARNTIMGLHPLADGRLAYGASDPSFGLLDAQGHQTLGQGPPTADFRANHNGFLVSSDGATVQFGYEVFGKAPARFDVRTRTLTRDPMPDSQLTAPRTSAPGLAVKDWNNTQSPKLNGQALTLKPYERSRSLAIAPDGEHFLLGSNWALRLFDRTGREQWQVPAPGVVWGVNIAGNGQVAVAAFGDGTIRWYRMSDGRELLAFFPHADQTRWIMWTPKGYFDASKGAEDLIGWHVNQGKDKEALFYPASQFFEQFYRHDLVAEVLKSVETDEQVLARLGEKERVNLQAGLKLPPKVAIVSPKEGEQFDRDEVDIQIQAVDQGGGIDEVRLYHNGKVLSGEQRGVAIAPAAGDTTQTKAFRVKLVDGANLFKAVALSSDRIESLPASLTIRLTGASKQSTLHVLLVGINEYKNPALNLNYALPDAKGLMEYFRDAQTGLFKAVTRHELYDKHATKAAIFSKLQELQATAPQDVVVIYLAGHGESIENTWYFVPHEVTTPEREDRLKAQGLSSVELKELIGKIGAQKVLVLMDACKSGSAMVAFAARGLEDRKALALLARSTGVHIVAASTKDQFAAEVKDLGHGVFTYTLLDGLSGKADSSPKDGTITVRELVTYVESRLPEVSEKYKQQVQYPVVDSRGQDFPLASVR